MMHRKSGRKLGVKTPHRKAMMANMCSSLILNDRVETTVARAKELRRIADRMITLGKRGTLHARRHAMSILRNRRAVAMIFGELAKRFEKRAGGYTRILKLGFRRGDAAPMAMVEYIAGERKMESVPEGKGKKAKSQKKTKAEPKEQKKEEKKAKPAGKKAAAKKPTAKKSTAKKSTKKPAKQAEKKKEK